MLRKLFPARTVEERMRIFRGITVPVPKDDDAIDPALERPGNRPPPPAADRRRHASPEPQALLSDIRSPITHDTRLESGKHRSIAVSTCVMAVAGDTAAGILLSQLIYWTRRGTEVIERDGWIFKTAGDWQQETGLSWKVQRRARDHLLRKGLIEECRRGMPARIEFRLQLDALTQRLADHSALETAPISLRELADRSIPSFDFLLGRSYLYYTPLAAVFPMHTAMLCSRLLATSLIAKLGRLSALATDDGYLWQQTTPFLRMHRCQWKAETGLTRDQWQTARRTLVDARILIERAHNYPRRVDLALNLPALARRMRSNSMAPAPSPAPASASASASASAMLASPPACGGPARPRRGGVGLDREKQHRVQVQVRTPPVQSPDPAVKDRLIPPIAIAQSCLYPLELQDSLQPPPQPGWREAARRTHLDFCGPGGGGGCAAGDSNTSEEGAGHQPATVDSIDLPASPVAAPAPPIWPDIFVDGDRPQAERYLTRLNLIQQQQVLDEIAWQHKAGKPVRSPVALLRALCTKVLTGDFNPDGAHRVAAGREQLAAECRRQRDDEASRSAALMTDTHKPAAEVRARLAAVRATLQQKTFA